MMTMVQIMRARFKRGLVLFQIRSGRRMPPTRLNLACGPKHLCGYLNIDITSDADLPLDLAKSNLPFSDNSIETVVCMSAINYFSRSRAVEIIHEIYRILGEGGVTRFGVQDMRLLAQHYLDRDEVFYLQILNSGKQRFEGETLGDKFASWFYGYCTAGGPVRYMYDYESLALLFQKAGFRIVEQKSYLESRLPDVVEIDNRPDQMFFLEAAK